MKRSSNEEEKVSDELKHYKEYAKIKSAGLLATNIVVV